MIKIMTIFGTRPEAIKMLPIVKEIEKQSHKIKGITVVTGQHREMLDQVLAVFQVTPDYDLALMNQNQTLTGLTTGILSELDSILMIEKPDIILVHGDTTTTFAASLAAFYHRIPIGHVEAGLRTWDKYSPFPEEMNRQLTDVLTDFYFAPTEVSKENLLKENHRADRIFITGNTVIDALQYSITPDFNHDILTKMDPKNKLILLTMHRRENQGEPMENVFQAIKQLVQRQPDVEVVFPVHLSPTVQAIAKKHLADVARVHLVEPLSMVDFHNLAARSYLILSDSGGVQEEAPSLHKPVLVLRQETERPEGVQAGTLKIIGTETKNVLTEIEKLLLDSNAYQKMATAKNPYGDGRSSARILSIIEQYLT
ncbi:UDP-N-acetylglucosamine 2-epimerase (non-hydrolyzing) [Enterococcus sp. MSG2901]|uniref:UDP-N-acetylglucosamine 2-epimerase (non-hydrolyzing) n=1 Tax=Candidatus Enterococcus courvalinii TaxID=2815329 RepID=A0ABS3I2X7_9ENTE|nr:UDP-N-acetylglucosamine 2-epimerase (non-hydrolyzing) [Enterococcus sp. MSG2901]